MELNMFNYLEHLAHNRVKKELNLKFDRLCRSTTEPSVNLTLRYKYKTFEIKVPGIPKPNYNII